MIPSIEKLIGLLPPFRDERILIKENQRVDDIINQLLIAHEQNSSFYDRFAMEFYDNSTLKICENICNFLKKYIKYVEESDKDQTTALPAAILHWRQGDCKHYASFTGGILSAIERETGKQIDWCYRFASYDLLSKSPHHVFVVVFDKGGEIWIDPVPGADKLTPVWQLDETVKNNSMALTDVVGSIPQTFENSVGDESISPELNAAVELLLHYGIVNEDASLNQSQYNFLVAELPEDEASKINHALNLVQSGGTIGSLASTIAHTMAIIPLAPGRAAFLTLVKLNFRSWAKHMDAVFKDPTNGQNAVNKISAKWYAMGGDWAHLRDAVKEGRDKKQLGSIGVIDWVVLATTAAAISAAIVPIINAFNKKLPADQQFAPIVPITTTTGTSSIMTWIKANPLPVVAALGLGAYAFLGDGKKKVGAANDNGVILLLAGVGVLLLLNKQKTDETPPIKENPLPVEELQATDPGNNPFTGATSYANGNAPFPVTIQPYDNVVPMYGQEQTKTDYSFL